MSDPKEPSTDEVLKSLTSKLINTERDHQRDLSFLKNKENRRDVLVKVIVYQTNTINGKIVRGDYQNPLFEKLSDDPLDPVRYRMFDYMDGEIKVQEMPMRRANIAKWTMGCFKVVVNYLNKMNVMDVV